MSAVIILAAVAAATLSVLGVVSANERLGILGLGLVFIALGLVLA